MARRARTLRTVWAVCLLLAGLNHARILVEHGLLWDYGGIGWPSAAYWSSLTLVDPLVAFLLLVRPRVGVPATIVLIVTNLVHNLAITAHIVPAGVVLAAVLGNWQLLCQIAFLLFVLATVRAAWPQPSARSVG